MFGITSPFRRSFNEELIALVVPIALQNLLSAAVISVDILMLGLLSQSVMSAVSLAGQVTFFLTLFYLGLATGVGIMTAQYWGKTDLAAIEIVLNIAVRLSVGISLLFFAATVAVPDFIMRLLTSDPELVSYGALFLRAVALSYVAMAFSQMYLSSVRSMEKARISAIIRYRQYRWLNQITRQVPLARTAT